VYSLWHGAWAVHRPVGSGKLIRNVDVSQVAGRTIKPGNAHSRKVPSQSAAEAVHIGWTAITQIRRRPTPGAATRAVPQLGLGRTRCGGSPVWRLASRSHQLCNRILCTWLQFAFPLPP